MAMAHKSPRGRGRDITLTKRRPGSRLDLELLRDIREIFNRTGKDFIPEAELGHELYRLGWRSRPFRKERP